MAETMHRFDPANIPAVRRLVVRKRIQVSSMWLVLWGAVNLGEWILRDRHAQGAHGMGVGEWLEAHSSLILGGVMLAVGIYAFIRRPAGIMRLEGMMLLTLAASNIAYFLIALPGIEWNSDTRVAYVGLGLMVLLQMALGIRAWVSSRLINRWMEESSHITREDEASMRQEMDAYLKRSKQVYDADPRLRAVVSGADCLNDSLFHQHAFVGECFPQEAYFLSTKYYEFHSLRRDAAARLSYTPYGTRVRVAWKTKFGRRRYEMGIFDAIQLKEWAGVSLTSKDVQAVCRCAKDITATRLAGILEYCDDSKLRVKLLSAAGKVIPSDDVATVLHRWARCDWPEVQLAASEQMAALRIGGLEPSLSEWLVSESAYLRRAAAIYLAAHPDVAYLERLDERVRIEDDRTTRGALKKAIKACTQTSFGTRDEFPTMSA